MLGCAVKWLMDEETANCNLVKSLVVADAIAILVGVLALLASYAILVNQVVQ